MVNLRNRHIAGPVAVFTAGLLMTTAALVWGGTAVSAPTPDRSDRVTAQRQVAHSDRGSLNSRIRGTTDDGGTVRGSFVPLKFSKKNGKLRVRGLIDGVVRNADGSTRTFGVMRTFRVKSIEGEPVGGAPARQLQAAATCDILNLVLGPLDLNILGLQINLNRVVLDIVAQSGPGNLLGNLLCAVAGLLDGGLNGLLGRVARLLNRILRQLGLGL